jgi:hypothetical protein
MHKFIVNWLSTKVLKTHNRETVDSSIKGAGKTRYPHTKEWNWTLILHHIQESTKMN